VQNGKSDWLSKRSGEMVVFLSGNRTLVNQKVKGSAHILNQRLRRELRRPNRSWRVDETYVRVAGQWTYLYRAVDSAGATIDFMLSPKRDHVFEKTGIHGRHSLALATTLEAAATQFPRAQSAVA
jgi:hypothetical protein